MCLVGVRRPVLDRNRTQHRARARSAMHKRAIALIRVLSVGGRSGARRTLRRRSSARACNRPRAPAPMSSSTWPGMKASLAAAGFGAQSAIATAHSARPGGRHQAHPGRPLVRSARAPLPGRASAPRPQGSASSRAASAVPPAPDKPPASSASRCHDQPAVAQENRPARERPIAIHQPLPADLDHAHDAEHPRTRRPPPSHTAHPAPPAAHADIAPPQRPRQPATRNKHPSHQIRPLPQLPRIQPQSRHAGRRLPPAAGPGTTLRRRGSRPPSRPADDRVRRVGQAHFWAWPPSRNRTCQSPGIRLEQALEVRWCDAVRSIEHCVDRPRVRSLRPASRRLTCPSVRASSSSSPAGLT